MMGVGRRGMMLGVMMTTTTGAGYGGTDSLGDESTDRTAKPCRTQTHHDCRLIDGSTPWGMLLLLMPLLLLPWVAHASPDCSLLVCGCDVVGG